MFSIRYEPKPCSRATDCNQFVSRTSFTFPGNHTGATELGREKPITQATRATPTCLSSWIQKLEGLLIKCKERIKAFWQLGERGVVVFFPQLCLFKDITLFSHFSVFQQNHRCPQSMRHISSNILGKSSTRSENLFVSQTRAQWCLQKTTRAISLRFPVHNCFPTLNLQPQEKESSQQAVLHRPSPDQ